MVMVDVPRFAKMHRWAVIDVNVMMDMSFKLMDVTVKVKDDLQLITVFNQTLGKKEIAAIGQNILSHCYSYLYIVAYMDPSDSDSVVGMHYYIHLMCLVSTYYMSCCSERWYLMGLTGINLVIKFIGTVAQINTLNKRSTTYYICLCHLFHEEGSYNTCNYNYSEIQCNSIAISQE